MDWTTIPGIAVHTELLRLFVISIFGVLLGRRGRNQEKKLTRRDELMELAESE
jgi:hypothetical protein